LSLRKLPGGDCNDRGGVASDFFFRVAAHGLRERVSETKAFNRFGGKIMKKGLVNMPLGSCPMLGLVAWLALATFTLLPAAGAQALPVTYNGVVSVDTVEAAPGDQAVVSVRLANNNIAIAGLTIPLQYSSAYLTVDSVSFVGTLKPDNITGAGYIDEAHGLLRVSYTPGIFEDPPTFSNAQGILAKIFFRVDEAAQAATVEIDSVNVDSLIAGQFHYWQRIEIADASGQLSYLPRYIPGAVIISGQSGVDDILAGLPTSFGLDQNYPNPFNPTTTISFTLPRAADVKLEVFNVLGQKVVNVLERPMSAGTHQVELDAGNLPSGIYFYRLSHPGGTETKKMVLLK
jgi:hypothetical protein